MCSKTALPEVSRVMCRASRMGTPLATRVPRVRTLRAMTFFSTNWPKMGIFKANMSQPIRPALNFRNSLMNSQMPMGMPGMRNHQFATQLETAISTLVMSGSSVPNSLKIFSNCGTIFNMMKVRMPTAKITTVIG